MRINQRIHHHAKRIGQHFSRHHRKYIYASMGYLLGHLFFLKIFLFKIVVLKIFIAILAVLGIYNQLPTFAAAESICINNEKLIPLSTCKINFTTLKDAIIYLENKVHIADATIYDSIDYQMLKDTLNHYCPEYVSKSIDQRIQEIIDQNLSTLPLQKYKRLNGLTKIFQTYKGETVHSGTNIRDTDEFCQQKYIDYAMIDESRKQFNAMLDKADLNKVQNAVFETIERKNDGILGPLIDEQISKPGYTGTQPLQITIKKQKLYETYYKDGSYPKEISEKVVQLSDKVINASLKRLQDKGALNGSDITSLSGKITVKYTPDCRKTQGYSIISQRIGGMSKKVLGADIQSINLNINICFNYQYMERLASYIEDITVHEIGHFIYYAKDKNPQSFERICRKNSKIACPKSEFISKYAQSGPVEDYAESFLHRYLGENGSRNIYTGQYYSGTYYSGGYVLQTVNITSAKLRHFSGIF